MQTFDDLAPGMAIFPATDEGRPISIEVVTGPVARDSAKPQDPAGIIPGPDGGSRPQHIVLTNVSSDSHTWNLVFIQLLLEYMGHRVTNLGACTPDDEVVDACRRLAPDLLVVSTVNGHGNIDGERLIGRVRDEPQLDGMPAVIGGKLGIHGDDDAMTERLLAAGFSAVFDGSTLPAFEDYVRRVSMGAPRHQLSEEVVS